jgi:hypothetical protein
MQNAASSLDESFYLWWVVDKKKQKSYDKSELQSQTPQRLDNCISDQV